MNLTFPGWQMSWRDLERGPSGQAFNGDDETHINPELRQALTKHTLKQLPFTQRPV